VTRRGVPVTVVFQGRPGRGAGPDFRGAVITGPSGITLRGDVELHVRSSSFAAHGHASDPAYANVILHVVFDDDTGADTPLPGGGTAPVVALAPWVARRADELQRWLERPLLWREPCHDAAQRLGAAGVEAALDGEGTRRLEARRERLALAVRSAGLDQTLYESLMEALGYGGNAPPMLALARLLPWRVLRTYRSPAAREALLLGSAGLLPSQRGHRGPIEPYPAELERRFAATRLPALSSGLWKLWGIRPANAPARRLAAAGALLGSLKEPSAIFSALTTRTVNEAIAPFTSLRASGYWLDHHDLCAAPSRLPPAYIGRARALEILINTVLPAAQASDDRRLADQAAALLSKLPRPAAYGATRFLERAISSEGVAIRLNARRAQGLLALNRDWCTQNGCGRCPLS
jgi:hypothetical protein